MCGGNVRRDLGIIKERRKYADIGLHYIPVREFIDTPNPSPFPILQNLILLHESERREYNLRLPKCISLFNLRE